MAEMLGKLTFLYPRVIIFDLNKFLPVRFALHHEQNFSQR